MNCYNHNREYVEITENDDGTYDFQCECGFHETIDKSDSEGKQ
jgi:hypothetical protein